MSSTDTNPAGSAQGLYMTLAPVLVAAGVYFLLFLCLRTRFKRWYAPRTYLGTIKEHDRTPALPNGLLNWFGAFWKIPDVYALQHQSLDSFLFLRFLRITIAITFFGCVITWPVLFPVNATGGGTQTQLNLLSYANVDNSTFKKRCRYFAHLFMAWIYFGFVMYMVFRECIYYVNLRQAYLLSPVYSQRLSSRTVLFTYVPESLRSEARVRKMFGATVRQVWILRNTDDLDKLVEEREKDAMRLEKSEVKLIKTANKLRLKSLKKGTAAIEEKPNGQSAFNDKSGSVAARWLPDKKRPTHRTGLLGLVGKKVDSINWCRDELRRLTPEVEKGQKEYHDGKTDTIPAIFVEFNTQNDAENAFQSVSYHQSLQMKSYIGITPEDVVWSSLKMPWWRRVISRYAVIAFVTALIIFWAIPVAVVGVISNVTYLETLSFLTWLKKVPQVVMGLIQGLLPSVALSILMSLVPIIMRLCAKLSGEPSYSRIELFTQNAYFCFQVIQVFLVSTVSSSASAVAKQIVDDPTSATELLASNLPKASNYYMSYFIVQGLGVASGVIAQIVGLIIFSLLYKYLMGTPRSLFRKWTSLSAISWGSTMPVYTNIAVIAITYAGIAPLVLGWACLGMTMFYLAWRYNVLFVQNTTLDTRGLIYPRAMKQLTTGVYLGEVCMIGLFGASKAFIQLALMVVFLVFTVLFHMSMNKAIDPLLYNMPQSLLSEEAYRNGDVENAQGAVTKNSTADSSTGTASTAVQDKYKGAASDISPIGLTDAPKSGNILIRFFKPWAYDNYEKMRQIVPQHDGGMNFDRVYTPEVTRNAYLPPSVTAEAPILWIPQDEAGISKQEVAHSNPVIAITDEGCTLNEKNNIVWDEETSRPPVWEEKIPY